MPDDTLLSWRTQTTVREVKGWVAANNSLAIGDFLWNRFDERYFAPFKPLTIVERNGFMIMAVSCLVVEALEAFHQGWESSDRKSQLAFCQFFDREVEFHVFNGFSQEFYKNVRCGILYQAETTGGWTTTLMPGRPMFDVQSLRIQADEFHSAVGRALKAYTDAISRASPTDDIWTKCVRKLNAIIRNCS